MVTLENRPENTMTNAARLNDSMVSLPNGQGANDAVDGEIAAYNQSPTPAIDAVLDGREVQLKSLPLVEMAATMIGRSSFRREQWEIEYVDRAPFVQGVEFLPAPQPLQNIGDLQGILQDVTNMIAGIDHDHANPL